MKHLLTALAGMFGTTCALAFVSVSESSIQYKTWESGKPSVMVLRTKGDNCTANVALTSRGRFLWTDADQNAVEPMTAMGKALLDKNGFDTDPGSTGLGGPQTFRVKEIALGAPEIVRKLMPLSTSAYDFQVADIESVPAGATKALLLFTLYSHTGPRKPHVLAVAFGEISDADLRQIAFEEGVARTLCWRQ